MKRENKPLDLAAVDSARGTTAEVLNQMSADLRAEGKRLQRLFLDSPTGMGLFGVHGRILAANRTLCRTLGYAESDLRRMERRPSARPRRKAP